MGYTLQQLQGMGAKPVGGQTLDQLKAQGATAVNSNGFPTQAPSQVHQSFMDKLKASLGESAGQIGNTAVGVGKGLLSTGENIGQLGQTALNQTAGRVVNKVTGKGNTPIQNSTVIPKQAITPTDAQKPGFVGEKVGEFLIPGEAPLKAEQAIQKGTQALGLADKFGAGGKFLESYLNLAGKMGVEGTTAGGVTALQGGDKKQIKQNAALGALAPVAGEVLSKGQSLASSLFEGAGKKIQTTVIKPSIKDMKDGFKIENVNKYGVGGSLNDTFVKTHQKMNDLTEQLKAVIGASDSKVDLNQVYRDTVKQLEGNTAKNFGQNAHISSVIKKLANEIDLVGEKGVVDLPTAQVVKQASGTQGSWVYGATDPEAKATEKVYNKFYNILKTKVEEASGHSQEMQAINKQLGDLIPINNAVVRRIPIAQRNGTIGLTDILGLTAAALNPKAAIIEAGNLISKSGKAGALISKVGEKIKPTPATTVIGKRLLPK